MGQHREIPTVAIAVPDYDPRVGVLTSGSAGTIRVEAAASGVEITGAPAGLLDLARWCGAGGWERGATDIRALQR